MNLKKIFMSGKSIIIPMALFAVFMGARCSGNNSGFYDESLLLAFNGMQNGAIAFRVDATTTKSFTNCRAVDHTTFWEVIGSNGSEVLQLFFGKLPVPNTYNLSTLASHEYIQYVAGGTTFDGVTDFSGAASSSITITTDNSTRIMGSFFGTVYDSTGTIHHGIDLGSFTALK